MERMVRPCNIRKMAEGSFINHGVTNDLTMWRRALFGTYASGEMSHILRNTQVHYRAHISPITLKILLAFFNSLNFCCCNLC